MTFKFLNWNWIVDNFSNKVTFTLSTFKNNKVTLNSRHFSLFLSIVVDAVGHPEASPFHPATKRPRHGEGPAEQFFARTFFAGTFLAMQKNWMAKLGYKFLLTQRGISVPELFLSTTQPPPPPSPSTCKSVNYYKFYLRNV